KPYNNGTLPNLIVRKRVERASRPSLATVRDGLPVLSKQRGRGCLPQCLVAREWRNHPAPRRRCVTEKLLRTSERQNRGSRDGLDFLRLSRRKSNHRPAMRRELRNLRRPYSRERSLPASDSCLKN